jgi:hypothetical protein
MAFTTIKVDTQTRDRLADLAKRDGVTLGEEVARLAERGERERFLHEVRAGYARLQEDPTAWADYQTEQEMWERASLADLGAAAQEYPEYNAGR